MKTKIVLFCLLISLTFGSKAQTYVTIPDANFVSWLQTNYPSCMSGNQMDITCAGINNDSVVEINGANISDLTGIEHFINLKHLDCINNNLTSFPTLPGSLEYLDCSNNNLSSLPTLPGSLEYLQCINTQLTSLPTLPGSLVYLNCSENQLTSLPALPGSLGSLYCMNNQLTSLPTLPVSLTALICISNQLTSLPALPNSILTISCAGNYLVSLPVLPNSLQSLSCRYNSLASLPSLPSSLHSLDCSLNQLVNLPTLPSIGYLGCTDNQLTSLPVLPSSLTSLQCGNNQLTSLPVLPGSLTLLYCYNNQLISLPALPSLIELLCSNNYISCFPIFPSSLSNLMISGNPFTCLPNYVPGMDAATLAYPLCVDGDLVNNSNGCPGAEGIAGSTYKDNNSNCILDAPDQGYANIHLKLYDSTDNLIGQTYSLSNGIYNFSYPEETYTVKVDTIGMPFTVQCASPGVDSTVTLTLTNPLASNVNFDIACKPGFDIGVQSVYRSGWVFPGLQHQLRVAAGDLSNWYGLNCANGIGGQVQITVSGPVSFDSIMPSSLTPSVSGNVFTYNIADYGNVNMNTDFGLLFTSDTTAQAGDTICVSVVVTPSSGDNNPDNNNYQFCYNVVNSYDPNMKEVYPVNVEPGYQDWLTYTIHFQNTGNAPAMNIRLTDTLDANLDLETFQVINYSHYNTVSMNSNRLTFHFPNIQLPDSLSNPEGSKGFVQYRIKPIAGLLMGTEIDNTAYIYFDYNPAIVTNTTTNLFDQPLSIKENKENISFAVYPNPGNGKYFVELSEVVSNSTLNIEIYNLLGELVLNNKVQSNLTQIDLSDQPNGVYIIKIKGAEKPLYQRLIKQ